MSFVEQGIGSLGGAYNGGATAERTTDVRAGKRPRS